MTPNGSPDDDAQWQPRGAPDLPPPNGAARHPNYWLGGWFGLLVSYAILIVFDPLQSVRVGLRFQPGEAIIDPAPILMMIGMVFAILMFHLLGLRPRVVVTEELVRVENPIRRWSIPTTQVESVDSLLGYARVRLVGGRQIWCLGLEEYHSGYLPPQIAMLKQAAAQRTDAVEDVHVSLHPPHWYDYLSLVALTAYVVVGVARHLA